MATIRRRRDKWQVQFRRKGLRSINQSFHTLRDAEAWARHMEVQADRHDLPPDPNVLRSFTLGQLVTRYRDTISVGKRTCHAERIVLAAFLRRPNMLATALRPSYSRFFCLPGPTPAGDKTVVAATGTDAHTTSF